MSQQNQNLIEPMEFYEKPEFIPVDEWQPTCPEDEIFKTVRGAVMLDVSGFFNLPESNPQLDSFIMSAKRSYNNPDMRAHTVQYLNYFEKYYDREHELPTIYCKLKYLIDFEPAYTKEAFQPLRKNTVTLKKLKLNLQKHMMKSLLTATT